MTVLCSHVRRSAAKRKIFSFSATNRAENLVYLLSLFILHTVGVSPDFERG